MPKRTTCWSIVKNLFSYMKSSEFWVGYLLISGSFIPAAANAETEETYFTSGVKTSHMEPSSICIHAAPDCFISAKRVFNKNDHYLDFEVSQLCAKPDPDVIAHLQKISLKDQLERNRFYGTKLCEEKLENKDPQTNPLISKLFSNTDYIVKFEKEDRVTIIHKPR